MLKVKHVEITVHYYSHYFITPSFFVASEDYISISQDLVFQHETLVACTNIIIVDNTMLEGTEFFVFTIPQDQLDPAVEVSNTNVAVVVISDPEDGKFRVQLHLQEDLRLTGSLVLIPMTIIPWPGRSWGGFVRAICCRL